ncbi:MAG: flagellar biosynthesis anti-sigma factor FlgM [Deltaproteobacteria bacterium]|nr:flagellar biosynthesis anti-sigma factor FlgM [Deltaproteobacteria bacterium]MBW1718222.1 flagellar biosynthesis anti-sigma factor FlgM [Deltaproteobacteria bacterium]
MKISEINNEFIKQYKISEKPNSGSKRQINENVVLEEKVSISSISRDVKLAKKAIEELPDVREEKVRGLKDQIEQGTYNVSGEKIAEKMFGDLF